MFTGLVEEVGTVIALRRMRTRFRLQIAAPTVAAETPVGASVSVNGCCLTLSTREDRQLTFDLLNETLERTNLGQLRPEQRVNLERALPADGRLGGHFVQGHIDCTARIIDFAQRGGDYRLEVELPVQFAHFSASKGSIAVNGISLTIADVLPGSFVTWIIPHTRMYTNLHKARPGDLVNLEFDVLAKYVERLLQYGQTWESKSDCSPRRIGPVTLRP
jgi:riboflavin synthase